LHRVNFDREIENAKDEVRMRDCGVASWNHLFLSCTRSTANGEVTWLDADLNLTRLEEGGVSIQRDLGVLSQKSTTQRLDDFRFGATPILQFLTRPRTATLINLIRSAGHYITNPLGLLTRIHS
jgi:hypothetical protein